jgi:dTMP kinase
LQNWGGFYDAGGILIADRYTTSNAVHQCCKLDCECWDAYLDWLFRFEYELLGLPEPDLVLYLRVPVSVNEKLMTERYHGNEQKKDIHERDTEYLLQAHASAEYCARKFGWHTVECTENDALRSIEAIGTDVLKAAEAVLD